MQPFAFRRWLALLHAPRIAALLLMTLVGSQWMGLAVSSIVNRVPPCCRAHGRHQCAAHAAHSTNKTGVQATTASTWQVLQHDISIFLN